MKSSLALVMQSALLIACIFLSGVVASLPVGAVRSVHPATDAPQVPVTIQTYGNAWEGYLAFGLWNFSINAVQGFSLKPSAYIVVMTTKGQVLALRKAKGDINTANWMATYAPIKYLGADTLMFEGEPDTSTHFWNLKTNETTDFPNIYGHHDMIFNPITGTFLTLWSSVRQIDGRNVLMDSIVELDSQGNVLWTWDTYSNGHFGLKDECLCNDTTVDNHTVIDLTHANSLQWDFKTNIIYMNMRALDTFCKIDKTTNQTIWCLGRRGNFKLLGPDGKQVPSLFYHAHDVQERQPDVFSMFDNDFDNTTNATNPCPALYEDTNAHSRMLEITVNEQNMTAWTSWSWTAPRTDWTPFWGSLDPLPNGDWIGGFGSMSHFVPGSGIISPLPSSTGAVLVEVNQSGQVVRTYTFPYGWGIYRVVPIPLQTTSDYDGSVHTSEFVINLKTLNDLGGQTDIYYRVNNGPTKSVNTDGQPRITTQGANNTLEYWSVDGNGVEESPHNILTGINLQTSTPASPASSINAEVTSEFAAVLAVVVVMLFAAVMVRKRRRQAK
jgi:hypothetical protein